MKERLIELICNCPSKIMGANMFLEKIFPDLADYLIENGVIVPPCKVGDRVYRVVEMSTGVTKVIKRTLCPPYKSDVLIKCKPTMKRFIRSVVVTKNNFFDVCENWRISVFPTKEEAEQKLKERKEE